MIGPGIAVDGGSPRRRLISPGLRLLIDRGRVITRRPVVLARALTARAHLAPGFALWPDVRAPVVGFDPGDIAVARWIARTFAARLGAEHRLGAATWQALRARALLEGRSSTITACAATRGLGRPVTRPRLAYFSPNASSNKVTVFVFEGASVTPSAVVKAMADRERGFWLRAEVELVAALRHRVAGDPGVGRALPIEPLFADEVAGDYMVVEPVDEMAARTGAGSRDEAMLWLQSFQRSTSEGTISWTVADERCLLSSTQETRGHTGPAPSADQAAELLRPLRGSRVPRCAVHGDFWRGNIARGPDGLRVYDWEWGRAVGDPFRDVWTYELAGLREQAMSGSPSLTADLGAAVTRVRSFLVASGIDPRFALATLAPTLADLVGRVRATTGRRGGWEDATALMVAARDMVASGH